MGIGLVVVGLVLAVAVTTFGVVRLLARRRVPDPVVQSEPVPFAPSNVRVLRDEAEIAAAITRAAASERQALEFGARRYAHYQGQAVAAGS
jgi:hypothetical protein